MRKKTGESDEPEPNPDLIEVAEYNKEIDRIIRENAGGGPVSSFRRERVNFLEDAIYDIERRYPDGKVATPHKDWVRAGKAAEAEIDRWGDLLAQGNEQLAKAKEACSGN